MTDEAKRELYRGAWHGEDGYSPAESIRLARAAEAFRDHAAGLDGSRRYDLLDVGCGVGPLRQWLGAEAFRIVGLEISAAAAEIARRSYDACETGDVERPWPFEPSSFDGVHAGAVLEHVVDWHAPLNHANRCLRDGGLLVVSVPNLRYWKEVRKLILGKQPHWLREVGHLHGYTPRFLRRLVELHGFEPTALEADCVNLPLLPNRWGWVRRRLAGIGSVLILTARLARRARVEDRSQADRFRRHKVLDLRSIEVAETAPPPP